MDKDYEVRGGKRLRPPRLSEKGLHDLAVDIVTNVTYIANDEDCVMSFPVLMLSNEKVLPKAVLKRTGAFYELWSMAWPRAINGRPMFPSVRLLHKDDLAPLNAEIDRIREALK